MIVRRIALNGFRNYDFETADFDAGTNVICGENAQGKTNLLEAVYMLAMGRSFRTRFDRELVSFGSEGADILADVYSHGREQTVNLRLTPGRPKRILVNSVKKTAGELSDTVNAVLFCPDDLNLIKEGAAVRRRLMDNAISQIRPRYAEILSDFNRLFENKTRILKDWRDKPSLLDTLDEFSDGMARASAQLIRYRAAFADRLQEAAAPIHREFSDGLEELEIVYKTVSTVRDPFAPAKEIYYDICDHQEKHRQAELDSAQCLTGAHKDDLEISVNGRSARSFASQGQTRTAALSLKLAEREIFLKETGEYPILLLDDVLSELDSRRQEFVLNRIGGGQTLITCCEDEGISRRTGGRVLFVKGGRIR
ncbi:MAG: DNA replication/repair protein RecF [Oscillospiraceae bacterium]|nr:DNA replication/repair protein RecF [Oscillospiraceae bacterium]MBR7074521.1 DNA replication/repair protein RecF [Oscillospiraceae bacterium]